MTKKKKNLILLLVLVVLMIAMAIGYLAISKKKEQEQKVKDKKQEEETSISLHKLKEEDVTDFHFKTETADVTLTYLMDTDAWVLQDEQNTPLNDTYVDPMIEAMLNLTATGIITKKPENLADYGLENPPVLVTVHTTDGSEYIMKIGNELSGDYGYYGMAEDGVLYSFAADTFEAFSHTRNQLIELPDQYTISDTTQISHLLVDKKDEKFEIERCKVDEKEDDNTANTTNSTTDYYEWNIIQPYKTALPADTMNLKEYLTGYEAFIMKECVDYEGKDLKAYGLDAPSATIKVDFSETEADDTNKQVQSGLKTADSAETTTKTVTKSYQLLVGNKDEAGDYFVKMGDANAVYTMAATAVEKLTQYDLDKVSDKCIYLGMISDMSGYEFVVKGVEHKVVRVEVPKTEEDKKKDKENGTANKTDMKNTYTVDGKSVDTDEFVNIFSATYLLEFTGVAKDSVKPADTKPVLELNYHMNSGEDAKIQFLPYDNTNFYRVNRNGMNYFLADKRAVDDIVKRYQAICDKLK